MFASILGVLSSRVTQAGLALFAILSVYMWGDSWRDKAKALSAEAGTVLIALRDASDNPDLKWKDAAQQVKALGNSLIDLKASTVNQNRRIDQMAKEAVRLRAEADKLREIADKAQAQRRAALSKLSDMAITPGTREDCLTLLREANEALDTVYEAGL